MGNKQRPDDYIESQELDVEGHRVLRAEGEDADVEGHRVLRVNADGDGDDDVEGHRVLR